MERKTVVIAQSDLERQKAVCEQIREYWLAQGRTPLAFVDTYGCQQNEADSERIRGMLQSCGYQLSDTEEGADCIVINTCAIREHAETRVYGNVGALVHTKARHPGQKIFLCGCMMGQPAVADRIKKSYRHVDGVFNPHQLWRFPELLQFVLAHNKRIFATDDSAGNIAEGLPVVRTSDLKAWVSIMYGCNNFCSYCIIPYTRGPVRSAPVDVAVSQAQALARRGYREIVVTGIEIAGWGADLPGKPAVTELIEAVWLFGLPPEKIQIVVQRQSIVHSAVQYSDNSIIAQLGVPDMRIPIQYALTYPARVPGVVPELDFTTLKLLTFDVADEETFRCLAACKKAIKKGGLGPCAANGANEEAVKLFLEDKIGFLDIGRLVEAVVDSDSFGGDYTLADVYECDKMARAFVRAHL